MGDFSLNHNLNALFYRVWHIRSRLWLDIFCSLALQKSVFRSLPFAAWTKFGGQIAIFYLGGGIFFQEYNSCSTNNMSICLLINKMSLFLIFSAPWCWMLIEVIFLSLILDDEMDHGIYSSAHISNLSNIFWGPIIYIIEGRSPSRQKWSCLATML